MIKYINKSYFDLFISETKNYKLIKAKLKHSEASIESRFCIHLVYNHYSQHSPNVKQIEDKLKHIKVATQELSKFQLCCQALSTPTQASLEQLECHKLALENVREG